MTRPRLVPLVAALALAGCGKKAPATPTFTSLGLADGCQPLLNGADCLLPYPSDFHRVADATLPSGFRVSPSGAALMKNNKGFIADPNDVHATDGYSRIPTLVTYFPEAITATGLVGVLDDLTASTVPSSAVVIVEASTGKLVAHFADLDGRATDPQKQAIIIHVATGLQPKTRYVVGVHGVQAKAGGAAKTPEGFRRLRDHEAGPDLAALSTRYDAEVFPVLATAGVARAELQQAWDFTTGSDEEVQSDMLKVRELTQAWLATNTPAVSITSVTDSADDDSFRTVVGKVTGPLFLKSDQPGERLNRDASGKVAQNGTFQFTFTAMVPNSVRDQYDPGLPLAYGHGFFGLQSEVTYGSEREVANHLNAVLFGIDWQGMSTGDVAVVAGNLSSRPSQTMVFADRVHQAMANWQVFTRAIAGPMRALPAFQRPASGLGTSTQGGVSNAGQPLYGPWSGAYLGISQGAILGGAMLATNPDIRRGVLNMGGAGFTHMMFRASPFSQFLDYMAEDLPDPFDQQKFVAQLQRQFDRFDPGTWAPYVVQTKLAGTPDDRRVLQQNGLGDGEVPNLGSYLYARQLGVPLLTPSVASPYGIVTATAPVSGSALVLWDFGIDLHAEYAVAAPATDNPVHEGLRKATSAQQQMLRFFQDGTVTDTCGGACHVP
jgi:hypothetical protein